MGSHFGEIAMVAPMGSNIRTSTVVTAEKCELNELHRSDLMACLENYPEERAKFFAVRSGIHAREPCGIQSGLYYTLVV